MIKNNEINLYYLLTNEMLADGITKLLKLIKYAGFIKIFKLRRKEKTKTKEIN